jgi:hypothetical protein
MSSPSRREFHQLALAAFSGTLAGSIVGCSGGQPDKGAESKMTADGEKSSPPANKTYDEKLLLTGDPHICRGLNQCKNQGKTKMNACAGQGSCATAEKHSCDALNACKGQGGCAQHPGENQCKGQGACQVPLRAKTWRIAREKFEKLMAVQQKKFGPAPASG